MTPTTQLNPRTTRRRSRAVLLAAALTAITAGLVTPTLSSAAAPAREQGVDSDSAEPRATSAMRGVEVPMLDWQECDEGFECATAEVPMDYDRPKGRTISLALIRHPAPDQENRIGSLFVNPGGPGGSGVEFVATAPPGALELFSQFDVVGWDPRGIGASRPVVDCTTDAEDDASLDDLYVRPDTANRRELVSEARTLARNCVRRNPAIVRHLSTANTARDLDLLRAAVGDDKLSYIGISHGTAIGATYSSLFPGRVRAMVADSPIDVDVWMNRPTESLRELAAANERGLQRFFAACAAAGTDCGFGGSDPGDAFDELVAAANAAPIPAPNSTSQTPVQGDDILGLVGQLVISRFRWPLIAQGLSEAAAGDASLLRTLSDQNSGRRADGGWAPTGAFFTTTAQDWRNSNRVGDYLDEGRHLFGLFPHLFAFGHGYEDIPYAVYPVRSQDTFRGPFTHPGAAAPAFVIGVTHDARTPYVWAKRYTEQLGNARLLTYEGDTHGALTDLNPCVIGHTIGYLNALEAPAEDATCTQHYPPFPTDIQSRTTAETWELAVPR